MLKTIHQFRREKIIQILKNYQVDFKLAKLNSNTANVNLKSNPNNNRNFYPLNNNIENHTRYVKTKKRESKTKPNFLNKGEKS